MYILWNRLSRLKYIYLFLKTYFMYTYFVYVIRPIDLQQLMRTFGGNYFATLALHTF